MDYQKEKMTHISYCGSYCHTCDWFTGRIKKTAKKCLDMIKYYDGFKKWFENKVDVDNLLSGLQILADTSICSGCKTEAGQQNDRCGIRQCCFGKGLNFCYECKDFPCQTLKTNPGVMKFRTLENLKEMKEKGIKEWIDQQWEKEME
ncbi:MAG: DUF3795 domain-containing protein [candidate division Zixibacteria bacterium]|nr:DUF3795 domain-containing protein [candidate division Zixibacteria bacterium]